MRFWESPESRRGTAACEGAAPDAGAAPFASALGNSSCYQTSQRTKRAIMFGAIMFDSIEMCNLITKPCFQLPSLSYRLSHL